MYPEGTCAVRGIIYYKIYYTIILLFNAFFEHFWKLSFNNSTFFCNSSNKILTYTINILLNYRLIRGTCVPWMHMCTQEYTIQCNIIQYFLWIFSIIFFQQSNIFLHYSNKIYYTIILLIQYFLCTFFIIFFQQFNIFL